MELYERDGQIQRMHITETEAKELEGMMKREMAKGVGRLRCDCSKVYSLIRQANSGTGLETRTNMPAGLYGPRGK